MSGKKLLTGILLVFVVASIGFREVNVEEPGNRHYIVMIAFGMRSIEAVFRGVTRIELWV